jgi:hypothetical protein
MHAHLDGRERRSRDGSYCIGKDCQLHVDVWQRRGRTRNTDRVVARITGFDSDSVVVTVVGVRVVIVVMLVWGTGRHAAIMVVAV